MHGANRFALDGLVLSNSYLNLAASHLRDRRTEFTSATCKGRVAVEQGDAVARLQAQHLHVTRSARRQGQQLADDEGRGAIEAGHGNQDGVWSGPKE